MGNRALLQVIKGDEFSPIIYLHWAGGESRDIIEKAAPLMRKGDVSYAFARLAGVCHLETNPEQQLSFGIFNADHILTDEDSHGDRGCFIVDCETGKVIATRRDIDSFSIDLT